MKASNPLPLVITSLLLASLCLVVRPASAQSEKSDDRGRPPDSQEDRTPVESVASTALRFTADGQHVLIPATNELNLISAALTIEAWVRPEAGILSRGYSSILSKQMGGSGYMLATNLATGPGHAFKAEVGGLQVTSRSRPAIDGWQHVAAVWDGGRLTLYVNGQLDGAIGTVAPIPNAFPLWIGSSPFGADTTWRGSIDEVRIWATARTQAQIQSGMNRYLCGDERGLRAYWSFDEGQGSEVTDASGNSDGVVSGPSWVPGVALVTSTTCPDKITAEALIDGRSRLIFRKNTVQWQHLDFAAPGRWEFRDLPTIISGEEWFPAWPDVPDAENRFCNCYSSVLRGVKPGFQYAPATVQMRIRRARGAVTVVEQPSAANDYAFIVEFDDNPEAGADTYRIELVFRRGDKRHHAQR